MEHTLQIMKRNLVLFLITTALLVQSVVAQAPIKPTTAMQRSAEHITAKQLSDYLYFVASDEMEGRDTPSRGLDLTAKFLAMNLSRWGFKPGGDDGTFFQKIALRREVLDTAATKLSIGGTDMAMGKDFVRIRGNGSATDAPLVFGKDGWRIDASNYDALSGVDVKGKIVVLAGRAFSQRYLVATPANVAENTLKAEDRGKTWVDPIANARDKGAAGVIILAPESMMGFWSQVTGFFGRGSMYPEKLPPANLPASEPIPIVLASANRKADLLGDIDPMTAAAGPLNKNGSVGAQSRVETAWTQNVVAIWEGSDPKLKQEMVAVGSHYDHVGVNPDLPGPDKIYNGADDDGSGTVAMLAIAEALAKTPTRPKRSILFVWHTGEEKGLWGAEYFNKFPTVDIKQVIAQLNIDMIGRSRKPDDVDPRNKDLTDENSVYVIGSEVMSSMLGQVVKGTNAGYLNMNYDYRYDAPNDPNRFFFRSDHFHYAVNGIPVAFWFTGVHEDYHQVGDHPDKIDYPKMEKIARTIYITLWQLAGLKERPKVDKQLPPELTRR